MNEHAFGDDQSPMEVLKDLPAFENDEDEYRYVAPTCIHEGFDCFRLQYRGPRDTVKSLEVDVQGNRVYAATAHGLYIWELQSHDAIAMLQHPQWVNCSRCYPPLISMTDESASTSTSTLPIPEPPPAPPTSSDTSTADAPTDIPPAASTSSIPSLTTKTERIITACENGVLTVWCAVTFRVRSRYRPGFGPLTDLQFCPTPHRSEQQLQEFRSYDLSSHPACAAISMDHVYILQIQPEVELLRDLVHPSICTAITTFVCPKMRCLLVGQENGTILCWSLRHCLYLDTLHYPAGESDVEADAHHSGFHVPRMDLMTETVRATFAFNMRRSQNPQSSGLGREVPTFPFTAEMNYSPEVVAALQFYNREGKEGKRFGNSQVNNASIGEEYSAPLVECLPVLPLDSMASEDDRQGSAAQWKGSQPFSMDIGSINFPVEDYPPLPYDIRRVTALTAGNKAAWSSSRFYSGHATGEVLVWEATFKNQPILLLKKVRLFPRGTWVWHMNGMDVAVPNDYRPEFRVPPSFLRKTRSAEDRVGKAYALPLIVWADSGEMQYLLAGETGVAATQGPGYLATASYSFSCPELPANILATLDHSASMLDSGWKLSTSRLESSKVMGSSKMGSSRIGLVVRTRSSISMNSLTSIHNHKPEEIHNYIVMGSFEGRTERFDVTAVVKRLLEATMPPKRYA